MKTIKRKKWLESSSGNMKYSSVPQAHKKYAGDPMFAWMHIYIYTHTYIYSFPPPKQQPALGSKFIWNNIVCKRWQSLKSHGLWGHMELNQCLFSLTWRMQSDLTEEYLTGPALPWNLNLSLHFLLSYTILFNPPVQTSQSVFLSLLPWRFPLPRFLFQSYREIQDVPNVLCHTIYTKCHGTD